MVYQPGIDGGFGSDPGDPDDEMHIMGGSEGSDEEKTLSDYIGGKAYPDSGVTIGVDDEGNITNSITTGTGDGTEGAGGTNYGGPDIAADPETDPVAKVGTEATIEQLKEVEQSVRESVSQQVERPGETTQATGGFNPLLLAGVAVVALVVLSSDD